MSKEVQWEQKLFKITHRIVLFLTAFQIFLFLIYVAGNRNLFLDTTLLLILKINTITSIVLIVVLTFYVMQLIFFLITKKKLSFLYYLILCAFSFVSALGLVFFTRAVVFFSQGFTVSITG